MIAGHLKNRTSLYTTYTAFYITIPEEPHLFVNTTTQNKPDKCGFNGDGLYDQRKKAQGFLPLGRKFQNTFPSTALLL
jgi:hypothetical protein